VRCTTPTTPACQKEQSIYCEESWRHLLPTASPRRSTATKGLAKRLQRWLDAMLHLPYPREKLTALGTKLPAEPPEPEPPPVAAPDGDPF
jgi:hypothetical protein